MCDYSLAEQSSRLAVERESLLVHRFPTGSVGLRPARRRLRNVLFPSSVVAVCIPPGARLVLEDIPQRLRHGLGVGAAEPVTFVQQNFDLPAHRDSIRFGNGKELSLQQLEPGQRVTVLSLGFDDSELAGGTPEEAHSASI